MTRIASGAMLKSLRHSLDLSVNDLADLIDVNERTIRRWEDGEAPKAVIMLLRMWRKYGIPVKG